MAYCDAHKDMVACAQRMSKTKLDKGSLMWIAGIFTLPIILGVIAVIVFMSQAEYRYGTYAQSIENLARIKAMEAKSVELRSDLVKTQVDMKADLIKAQTDIMDMLKEIRRELSVIRGIKANAN